MPFTKKWLLKDQVNYIKFTDRVTLQDIEQLSEAHQVWTRQMATNILGHCIVDATDVLDYPKKIRSIKNHLNGRITHTEWLIFIADDYYLNHMVNIFAQLFHFKVKIVASFQEATLFLQDATGIQLHDDKSACV